MNKERPRGNKFPEPTITGCEAPIEERTTFDQEVAFVSTTSSPSDAPGAMIIQQEFGEVQYAAAGEPRPQVTHHRHQGDLSNAQFQLLQNLERLTHSLQGPEDSLDRHGYNRPFPQPIKCAQN